MEIRLIAFALSLCFLAHFAYAGDELANYLSQKIYRDCNSSSNTFLSPVLFQLQPNISGYIGKSVTPELMDEVVAIIIENGPYGTQASDDGAANKSGASLIVCGNRSLDADSRSYWWGGELIDSSQYVYNQTQVHNQTTIQNIAQVSMPCQPLDCNGATPSYQYSIFSDNNLYATLALSVFVSLLSVILLEIALHFYGKNKINVKNGNRKPRHSSALQKKSAPRKTNRHLRRA